MASYLQLGPGVGSRFLSSRPQPRRRRRPLGLIALTLAIAAGGLWLGAQLGPGPARVAAPTFIAASPP